MAWPNGSRLKTFAAAGSYLPADANAVEERMLQVAGYRGSANIPGADSRTNVAFGNLTTPDQVTGIVLPTDGLIAVAYQAQFQSSVIGAGQAGLFLGSNIVTIMDSSVPSLASVFAATSGAGAGNYTSLSTHGGGLVADGNVVPSDSTTGQLVGVSTSSVGKGGFCYIFAAAGTYTVSVQFKSSSGSVTAKTRKLWVATMAFS
jgi:hypothetical protein